MQVAIRRPFAAVPPRLWRLAALTAGSILLVLRLPETLLAPSFWHEDGPIFYADPSPLAPYQGYLQVIPRVVGAFEHLVPFPALLGNATALAITLAVVAFLASDRMSRLVPEPRLRLMAAAVVLLLPASYELLGSITYSQWYLALYLLFGAFAWPAAGPWRWPDRLCLAVVSLTGPFSIFAAPLYWLRRDLRTSAVIVTAGAFVQLSTGFSAPRVAFLQVPDDLLGIVAGRLVLEPLLGELIVAFVPLFAALILVIPLVLCLRSVPISLVLATIAIAAAGVLYSPTTSAVLLQPWGAQRYFFLSGAVIAFAIVLSAARGERAGRLLGPLLVLAVLIDFRIPWR